MKVLAEGKDNVIAYLEDDAQRRTGGPTGIYRLEQHDNGDLVLFLAGHAFSGTFVYMGGKDQNSMLKVVGGIVVEIVPQP